jgi:selenocysteine lyase/cysteine desulfurase
VSITLERHTAGEAAAALGEQGICVWDGDFYAARAVEILGLGGRGGLLRTGISLYTARAEIDRLLAVIGRLAG